MLVDVARWVEQRMRHMRGGLPVLGILAQSGAMFPTRGPEADECDRDHLGVRHGTVRPGVDALVRVVALDPPAARLTAYGALDGDHTCQAYDDEPADTWTARMKHEQPVTVVQGGLHGAAPHDRDTERTPRSAAGKQPSSGCQAADASADLRDVSVHPQALPSVIGSSVAGARSHPRTCHD